MNKVVSCMKAKQWVLFLVFVLFVFFQVILTLRLPGYMEEITGVIQTTDQMQSLVRPGILMFLCAVGSLVCAIAAGFCLSQVSSTICMRLREETFEKIISFSLAEMNQYSPSSLITRCTNDIMQIQFFATMGVLVLVQGPITAVLAIAKMKSNVQWLIASGVVLGLVIIIHVIAMVIVLPRSMKLQKMIDKINLVTREHISGLRVVHAYNGYEFQRGQFEVANDDLTKMNLLTNRTTGMLAPFLTVFKNGLSIAIYVLGALMITQAGAEEKLILFSEMVAFSSYALQAIGAFLFMMLAFMELPRAIVSLKRIAEVLDTEEVIKNGRHEEGANGLYGEIEFRDVSFAYPGASANALSNISFKIEKGETFAIIGSTGSGKTTLMNLISRLYDVTEGQILVDGRDVKDYKMWALRDKMGYVPQKSFLFSGTISSNINYGKKSKFQAAITDIKNAAEVGQSKEFIEHKEGGYEARVEEGGSNFSGGQRQRLTISRAICRDPEIYLFDDSFSALDFKTDSVLRRQLRKHAEDATMIIVGQRVGSIKHADSILVLDKGRVVGKGTHEELMKNCEVYREIAYSQLSTEEAV